MGNKIDYSTRAPADPKDLKYVKSFGINDNKKEIEQFYKKYGFVVFDDLLSNDEIDNAITGLWKCCPDASREDPSTWEKLLFPVGFAGNEPLDSREVWNVRQNFMIHKAFKLLYELVCKKPLTEPLVSCLDRGSIMRPTSGPNGKSEWLTQRLPHFDMNPWVWCGIYKSIMETSYDHFHFMLAEGNNTANLGFPKLRAVLQLSDSTEHAGGFECLPGFNNIIRKWCKQTPSFENMSPYGWGLRETDEIVQNMQKITCRAGSLIIFSAELPHTMFPNESENFRYALYLRMTPLSTLQMNEEQAAKRKELIAAHLPPDLEITDIGKEVFLLDR